MSDTAQGADWWLASDGKWYPPASRLPVAPPPPPPVPNQVWRRPPTLSPTLTAWVQGLLWLCAAGSAASMLLGVIASVRFTDWWEAPAGRDHVQFDAWIAMDDAWAVSGIIVGLLALVTGIVFIVWMNKAHKVTSWIRPANRRWSSGWTVGGWFVPVGNLVIPRLVLGEIERLATDARSGPTPGDGWKQQRTMPIGWVWWIAFIGGSVLSMVSSSMLDSAMNALVIDPDQIRGVYGVGVVSDLAWVVAAVCGAAYVRALGALVSR
jgi:hypothetical protein